MSRRTDALAVSTLAGLTLELSYWPSGPCAGEIAAELLQPERGDLAGASRADRRAAFLAGGRPDADVYVEPRLGPQAPAAVWISGASIDLDDATAATVQAWLASRPPVSTAPAAQAVPA